MPITVRTLLKSIVGFAVALLGPATKVMAQERSPAGSMAAFIAKLRADESLRLRFQENPSAVMRAEGIDPTPYRLPHRLTQMELDRLLADWSRAAGPAETPPPRSSETTPGPSAPVYGPPPGPPRPPEPRPPAPVYGPPPGLPR